MTNPRTSKSTWNPWPVSIACFFVVAIAACASYVAFCLANPTELVSPNYYEQEIRYQSEMDRLRRGQETPQTAAVAYNSNERRIEVSLPPTHVQTANFSGTVHLYRPSSAQLDQQIELRPDSNGLQSIEASALPPGPWRVKVSWSANGQDYQVDQKIILGSRPS